MIKKWIKDINEERPLWLAECREESKENEGSHDISIDVISSEGNSLSFEIALPPVESAEEIALMGRFLDANRVNAAVLLGQMDDTDCAMPPAEAMLRQIKAGAKEERTLGDKVLKDKLICSVAVGGNDIKLAIAENGSIRKVLAYDWNPRIAIESAMISNPIFELCEMAKNYAGSFDSMTVGVSSSVSKLPLAREIDFAALLSPLCKESGVRVLSAGSLAAFSVYNELSQSEAGAKILENGINVINLDDDIEIGMVDECGMLSKLPLDIAECILRIDVDNGKFPSQKDFLAMAKMPDTNPKPCYDLLFQMAEGGDRNAETLFMDLGNYLGHAVREYMHFVKPKSNKFFFTGKLAENSLVFDLIALGMQKAAPDVDFIEIDKSLAVSPLMTALSKNEATPTAEFASVIGALYYTA